MGMDNESTHNPGMSREVESEIAKRISSRGSKGIRVQDKSALKDFFNQNPQSHSPARSRSTQR